MAYQLLYIFKAKSWELIFIHCGLSPLILVVFFLCCFFFHYVSAKFHLWPSSGDLLRPRIEVLSLVTVSPVITAFHSCCLSHHVFWPSKPLAGLGRIWNRYLLTMLTWNRRDSTPLSAAPWRAIKDGFFGLINPYLVFQSRVRTEFFVLVFNWNHFWDEAFNLRINCSERRNNTHTKNYQDEGEKSAINKN